MFYSPKRMNKNILSQTQFNKTVQQMAQNSTHLLGHLTSRTIFQVKLLKHPVKDQKTIHPQNIIFISAATPRGPQLIFNID